MQGNIRSIRSEISEVRISEVTFGVKQYLLYALQGLNESSRLKKTCLEIPSDSIEDAYILPHTHPVYKSAMDPNDSFNFIVQDNDQFMMDEDQVMEYSCVPI